jgi:hypothetical protein
MRPSHSVSLRLQITLSEEKMLSRVSDSTHGFGLIADVAISKVSVKTRRKRLKSAAE